MERETESKISPSLEIRLLGTFQIVVNGIPTAPLRSRQGQALLGLLALRHASEIDREWLAFALWPDSSEAQARYNLRRNLTDLRRSLGSEAARLLAPTPRTLRLDLTGAVADFADFDAALAAGGREHWEQAAALYRGDLLPGCDMEAINRERERRTQGYFEALEHLAAEAAAENPGAAAGWLRRLLAADPLRESALRDLMRLLAQRGEFAAITEAYRNFRVYLRRELSADPAPETAELYRELSVPDRNAPLPVPPAAAAPRRLPAPLSRLIGRDTEIAATGAALKIARLLTLVGMGGIGKTRLALAAAESTSAEVGAGGVWFVDFAPLTEGASVLPALARALEVAPQAAQTAEAALREFLAPCRALLIFDNCEHLLSACADAAQTLLTACPRLKILATSRQPLGLMGEALRQVPALDLPPLPPASGKKTDGKKNADADAEFLEILRNNAAVQLFAERACLARTEWELSPANAVAVAQICRQLDGLPLAIELAAARIATLPAEAIAAKLEDRFRLLTAGNRGAMPRHQNLTALLDWSYDLLTPTEQTLLRRLAVFAGGWTLEAAEAVCGAAGNEQNEASGAVYYLLAGLVEKSLVVCDTTEETARYRMLETVRQYAHQRLDAEPGAAEIGAARHGDFYLTLAMQAEAERDGPKQVTALERLEREHDNLRAALVWLRAADHAEKALRLACALSHFWSQRNYLEEGYACLTECFAAAEERIAPPLRAAALQGLGGLALSRGDYSPSAAQGEAALALYRTLNDRRGAAAALILLADLNAAQGEYERARPELEQALAISREIGNAGGETAALGRLGYIAREMGDYAESRRLTETSLAVKRRIGDRLGEGWNLGSLGYAHLGAGDAVRAVACFEGCLVIYRECGQRSGEAWTLTSLGHAARRRGDFAASRAALEAGRAIYQEMGRRASEAWNLDELGATLLAMGEGDAARRALYDSLCLHRESGSHRQEAICLFRLGHLFREESDPVLARRFYTESARILIGLDLPADLPDIAEGLVALETEAERPESAARIMDALTTLRRPQGPAASDGAKKDIGLSLTEAIKFALRSETDSHDF